jgi:hypothetical protein
MIEGVIHVLDVGEGNFMVVFTSLEAPGRHLVSSVGAAHHFISSTLSCDLKLEDTDSLRTKGIKVRISTDHYRDYFSK